MGRLHQRPEGTAKRNFAENRNRFIENEDYFLVKPADIQKNEIRTSEINNRGTILLTQMGYLMLVKSFTDDLAWHIQRQLVNNYFQSHSVADQRMAPHNALPKYSLASGFIASINAALQEGYFL